MALRFLFLNLNSSVCLRFKCFESGEGTERMAVGKLTVMVELRYFSLATEQTLSLFVIVSFSSLLFAFLPDSVLFLFLRTASKHSLINLCNYFIASLFLCFFICVLIASLSLFHCLSLFLLPCTLNFN